VAVGPFVRRSRGIAQTIHRALHPGLILTVRLPMQRVLAGVKVLSHNTRRKGPA
jgi:uncharacterized membrane protein